MLVAVTRASSSRRAANRSFERATLTLARNLEPLPKPRQLAVRNDKPARFGRCRSTVPGCSAAVKQHSCERYNVDNEDACSCGDFSGLSSSRTSAWQGEC